MLLLLRGCFAVALPALLMTRLATRGSLRKFACPYQRAGDASTLWFGGSLQLESASAYNPNSRPRVVQYGGAYIYKLYVRAVRKNTICVFDGTLNCDLL